MKQLFFFILSLSLWSACHNMAVAPEPLPVNTYYHIDSLLDEQIALLTNSKAKLLKTYRSDDASEEVTLAVDHSQWNELLSAFRILDINKPFLKDAYDVIDNIADSSSNLTILQYQIKDKKSRQLLKILSFYYLESIENLKKIVAKSRASGFVYGSDNVLELTFNQSDGQTHIEAFTLTSSQKTLFQDTSHINIDFEVWYDYLL